MLYRSRVEKLCSAVAEILAAVSLMILWGGGALTLFWPSAALAVTVTIADLPDVTPGLPVVLNGSVTDAASAGTHIESYRWDVDIGGPCLDGQNHLSFNGSFFPTSNDTVPVPPAQFTVLCNGGYLVNLTLTDDHNANYSTNPKPFQSVDTPPIVDPGPDISIPHSQLTNPMVLTFDGSHSMDPDPVDSVVEYNWLLEGQNGNQWFSIAGPTITLQPSLTVYFSPQLTTYRLTLQVRDRFGVPSAPAYKLINLANSVPVVTGITGPRAVFQGDPVQLCPAGYDPDGDQFSFVWFFNSLPSGFSGNWFGYYSFSYSNYPSYCINFVARDIGDYKIGVYGQDMYIAYSTPVYVTVTASARQIDYVNLANGPIHDAVAAINALPDSAFKNRNMKLAFTNKLQEVLQLINDGAYLDASSKLKNDILAKMSGNLKNDWLTQLADENVIRPLITSAIGDLSHVI